MDLRSASFEELSAFLDGMGEQPFRARQLFAWLHEKQAADLSEMSNLSKKLRQQLAARARLTTLQCRKRQISSQDGTRKYLLELPDGNFVETVCMRYKYGCSVCVSSQVGCAMGCRFCASTLHGCIRNLTAGEMLEQVYAVSRDIGERISHVVVMGMGEPLLNMEQLLRFIRLLSDERGQNLSVRSVTVSTCGIVPAMRELAGEGLPITLALSLHAPSQEKRERLMPVARQYGIREVVDALFFYAEQTGRRATVEYAMIAGENDGGEDADQLAALLKSAGEAKLVHVNLIPLNPVRENALAPPSRACAERFLQRLQKQGIPATIRRELGADIDSACGQLRNQSTGV